MDSDYGYGFEIEKSAHNGTGTEELPAELILSLDISWSGCYLNLILQPG